MAKQTVRRKSKSRQTMKSKPKTYKKVHTKSLPKNEPVIIGLVYANWCPHCQHLKPEWNVMKNELMNKYNGLYTIVEIEESQPDKLEQIAKLEQKLNGNKIEANGYPTIFKLNGGNVSYYDGNRDATSMLNWITDGHKGGYQRSKRVSKQRAVLSHTPNRKSV